MTNSIVEIAQDGRHISLFRGFLKISEGEEELARIPLDSIHALLLNCHQATLTQNILLTCAENGIPVSVMPCCIISPGFSFPEKS
jgi:CRISPR-associated protein Cas1